MTRRLTIAEQCIDRQERTDVLDGHQIKVVTGRVLLHASTVTSVLCAATIAIN